MKIAVAQMVAPAGAVAENLSKIADALRHAAEQGASLLVAPELALPGYGAGDSFPALAETAEGSSLSKLTELVDRTGCALIVGFAEAGEAGRVHNSAAALVPGRPPAVYRKVQLYGPYEREHFEPGPVRTATVDVGDLKVGLLICYDVEFPEHVRRLAQAGCDLIAVPTALPGLPTSRTVAERVVPVRAFENQVFVAYADLAGHDGRFPYMGLSCIAAPDGTDLARAPAEGDALLFADILPSAYAESREANPYLADLRLP